MKNKNKKKIEKNKYVWVDDDNHFLKGYFILQDAVDTVSETVVKRVIKAFKKAFNLK